MEASRPERRNVSTLRLRARIPPHPCSRVGVRERSQDLTGQIRGIVRLCQQPGHVRFDELRYPTNSRCNHRPPSRLSLEDDAAQALRTGREDEQVTVVQRFGNIVRRDRAEELDRGLKAEPFGVPLELRAIGSVADKSESRLWTNGNHLGPRVEE